MRLGKSQFWGEFRKTLHSFVIPQQRRRELLHREDTGAAAATLSDLVANVGLSLAVCIREAGHKVKMPRKNKNYSTMQTSCFFPTFGKSNEAPLHRCAGGGCFILSRPLAPRRSKLAPAIQSHHHLDCGASWQEADPQPHSEPFLGAWRMLGWRILAAAGTWCLTLDVTLP